MLVKFSSVQSLSHVQLFATPWTVAHQTSLSITNSWSLLKLISIELVMPFNQLILCHLLLLPPSIFPSFWVFSNESVICIRWPKDWSFSFNISPSNEHPGLISFRMDWLDLLAVQGTLMSVLQQHSSKASVLEGSAFFIVQLSHLHMTTEKTIALSRWIFVGKVMSLLLNMLSSLVITFLPWSKHLLIRGCSHHLQWFWSPQNKVSHHLHLLPHLFALKWWDQIPWSYFSECWVLNQLFPLSSFIFIKRLFSSSFSAIRVVSSAYLRLLIFLLAILIPACVSSNPAFHMMYPAYKLNKQGDIIQP